MTGIVGPLPLIGFKWVQEVYQPWKFHLDPTGTFQIVKQGISVKLSLVSWHISFTR